MINKDYLREEKPKNDVPSRLHTAYVSQCISTSASYTGAVTSDFHNSQVLWVGRETVFPINSQRHPSQGLAAMCGKKNTDSWLFFFGSRVNFLKIL